MPGRSVDDYGAPLFIACQLTNRCPLRCIACCEESRPDKAWADEVESAYELALISPYAATSAHRHSGFECPASVAESELLL
jgi:hypothetical protein